MYFPITNLTYNAALSLWFTFHTHPTHKNSIKVQMMHSQTKLLFATNHRNQAPETTNPNPSHLRKLKNILKSNVTVNKNIKFKQIPNQQNPRNPNRKNSKFQIGKISPNRIPAWLCTINRRSKKTNLHRREEKKGRWFGSLAVSKFSKMISQPALTSWKILSFSLSIFWAWL